MSTLLLIDLSAFFHQAWHVTNSDDGADEAARSTVRRVRSFSSQYDHIAVCVDSSPTWRHALSPSYKAQRAEKPIEFGAQYKRALFELERDGFVLWKHENQEADDVIASATRLAIAAGHQVTIATADKDLHQLVTDRVSIYNIGARRPADGSVEPFNPIRGPVEVREKFGVKPSQLGDWLALQGDKSDNIEGLPGVGEVTATMLLQRYGDLRSIIDIAKGDEATELALIAGVVDAKGKAARPMGPKLRSVILAGETTLAIARQLVTLRDDLPIPIAEAFAERVEQPKTEEKDFDMPDAERDAIQNEDATSTEAREARPALSLAVAEPQQGIEAAERPETFEVQPSRPAALSRVVEWQHTLEPTTFRDCQAVSQALHNSRLFAHFGSWQAIFATIMIARSHGIESAKLLMPGSLHQIKGKLTMSAQLVVGLVLRSGLCEYFDLIESNEKIATFETKRKGAKHAVRMSFTIDQAKRAGYLGKGGSWVENPESMLRHRAEMHLARAVYQDVTLGLYSPEEIEDAA